jgi:exopolysaccharide production protein ExoZ
MGGLRRHADHFGPNYLAMGGSNPVFRAAMPYGFFGVDVFFVISGFVMMHVIAGRAATPPAVREFLGRRFLRIYGWYLPCMAAGLGIMAAYDPAGFAQVDLLRSITLTSVHLPELALATSWSLSYELYFYVLVAACWFCAGGRMLRVLWPAFAALCVFSWFVPYREGTLLSFLTSPFILEFLAGALLYQHRQQLQRKALLPWLAAAVVLLFWLGVQHHATNNFIRVRTFGAAAWFLVCFFVVLEDTGLYRARKLALSLGDASYSIYLLHLPLMSLFYGTGLRDFLASLGGLAAEAGFVAFLALFLFVCVALHTLAERPLYQFMCRLLEPRRRSMPASV